MKTANLDKYLESLTTGSEFVGLIGRDHPTSFYKVFVRATPTSKWWKFETEFVPHRDPFKDEERIEVAGRVPLLWAPLAFLVDYQVIDNKPALQALVDHVKAHGWARPKATP